MKKIISLSLCLLAMCLNAQIKFEEGHYIINNQDTIKGQIKNYDWKNNPSQFEFSKDYGNSISIIKIDDAKEFEISNRSNYIRATVQIDRSSEIIEYLSKSKKPVFKEEQIFLKTIVKGKASLYYY